MKRRNDRKSSIRVREGITEKIRYRVTSGMTDRNTQGEADRVNYSPCLMSTFLVVQGLKKVHGWIQIQNVCWLGWSVV